MKLEYRITAKATAASTTAASWCPIPSRRRTSSPCAAISSISMAAKRYPGNNYEEKGGCCSRSGPGHARGRRPSGGGASRRFDDTKQLAALQTEDWNAVHISARGNTLTHMLNGRLMSVVIDDDAPNRPADGLIGMQVHVGPPMTVEYRNIRLKNWSWRSGDTEHSGNAPYSRRPSFSGLSGWPFWRQTAQWERRRQEAGTGARVAHHPSGP